MSNDLMIPEASEVPAHIRNAEFAKKANEDMAAGISTGFPPSLRLNGKQFVLVDGNGDKTPIKPGNMFTSPEGDMYLPVIVLRAKRELTKSWYAAAYNPNADAVAPDCFSNDGERPDPSAPSPQCDTCASCQNNAWGSGTDQNGISTKGKACSDTKTIAVFVPQHGIHAFKIPPASLKNFGLYVKQLSTNGIPLTAVKTLVGFDDNESFPIMVFRFGGFLNETVAAKITELAASPEAEEAIGGISVSSTKAIPAPEPKKESPAVQQQPADDLGLGIEESPTEKPAPKKEAVKQPESNVPSDEDLMAALSL